MSGLDGVLADYLALRRAVGFSLANQDRLLADFLAFLADHGEERITARAALSWASQSKTIGARAKRLGVVRVFARYAQASDPATEVPGTKLLPNPYRRPTPYLYEEGEVVALMEEARHLVPQRWGMTCATLIGLLWATGLRAGEALRLDREHVALDEAVLTVWVSKGHKSRLVPLSGSTLDALAAYDRVCDSGRGPFFVDDAGERVETGDLANQFTVLLDRAGVPWHSAVRQPRLGDLRHSFATGTLLRWYRDGADVGALVPRLSTYLGHVGPASTYWYLSAAPELLALAAERVELIGEVAP